MVPDVQYAPGMLHIRFLRAVTHTLYRSCRCGRSHPSPITGGRRVLDIHLAHGQPHPAVFLREPHPARGRRVVVGQVSRRGRLDAFQEVVRRHGHPSRCGVPALVHVSVRGFATLGAPVSGVGYVLVRR